MKHLSDGGDGNGGDSSSFNYSFDGFGGVGNFF